MASARWKADRWKALETAARRLGIRPGTATQYLYLARVKREYDNAGRPARTKLELAARARGDGLIP